MKFLSPSVLQRRTSILPENFELSTCLACDFYSENERLEKNPIIFENSVHIGKNKGKQYIKCHQAANQKLNINCENWEYGELLQAYSDNFV